MILSIIISLAVFGSILISGLIVLDRCGLGLPDGHFRTWLYGTKRIYSGDKIQFKDCVKVCICALAFRILIYILAGFLMCGHFSDFNGYLRMWQKWDASNYIRIAELSYNYTENGKHLTVVFFPLYSWIMRAVNMIFNNYRFTALAVSSVSYSIACGYIYALVGDEYNRDIAMWTIIFLSIFPFSFFYGGMMTESTFLLTTAMSFYYIRQHKWYLVGIIGILSALSRLIGVFIVVPAVIELCVQYKIFKLIKKKKIKRLFDKVIKNLVWIALTFIGTGIYLYINYKFTGSPFKFLEYQQNQWHHERSYFANTLADIIGKAMSSNEDIMIRQSIWIPSAFIFVYIILTLLYSARRHSGVYTLYMAGYLIINCSVSWLISAPRYMSALLPMFIVTAEWTGRYRLIRYILAIFSFVFLLVYLQGYLMGRQIM